MNPVIGARRTQSPPRPPVTTGGRRTVTCNTPFRTEQGATIDPLRIAYHAFGTRAADDHNVVWVCHALTADSDPTTWWPGLVGTGLAIDPAKHFIICANMLGSCYGSSGPTDVDPATGRAWLQHFPFITVRDMVAAHRILADHLGLQRIGLLIGGSMGGQQALEWAIEPERPIDRLVVVATNAAHSPFGIAFNAAQRMAIEADPSYYGDDVKGGAAGLKAARAVALLSYRTRSDYNLRQTEKGPDVLIGFRSEGYQRHQGDKLATRFNAHSYVTLGRAMDAHHVGRGRGGIEQALARITARTLVLGLSTDLLFPPDEQRFLTAHIPGARFAAIDSLHGHDGFLLETNAITEQLNSEFIP